MHRFTRIFSAVLLSVTLAACQNQGAGYNNLLTKENVGAAAGAVGGAVIGSNIGKGKGQIAAIAAGTLLGGALGKSIGRSLDRADLAYHHRTSQAALENNKTGRASQWRNPDSGHSGTVTPTKTYQTSSGTHCREYTQTINVGGKTEKAFGTACRQNDGSWKIVR